MLVFFFHLQPAYILPAARSSTSGNFLAVNSVNEFVQFKIAKLDLNITSRGHGKALGPQSMFGKGHDVQHDYPEPHGVRGHHDWVKVPGQHEVGNNKDVQQHCGALQHCEHQPNLLRSSHDKAASTHGFRVTCGQLW